jgi:hypothetical protein
MHVPASMMQAASAALLKCRCRFMMSLLAVPLSTFGTRQVRVSLLRHAAKLPPSMF